MEKKLPRLYCKSDVFLLADVFEKLVKVSTKEYKIIPLDCVSLPGYTYQCALKYTDFKLQTLQDKNLILLIKNSIRGGNSSVIGDRYVKSDEKKIHTWMPLIYMVIRCLKCYLMMKWRCGMVIRIFI